MKYAIALFFLIFINGCTTVEYTSGGDAGYGNGIMTGFDGIYEGELYNAQPEGRGKYKYNADKRVCKGIFRNSRMNGRGSCRWASGDSYIGEWVNGLRQGKGTYRYSNGDLYVGEWFKGDKNGSGVYTWADGTKYTGIWIANKRVSGSTKRPPGYREEEDAGYVKNNSSPGAQLITVLGAALVGAAAVSSLSAKQKSSHRNSSQELYRSQQTSLGMQKTVSAAEDQERGLSFTNRIKNTQGTSHQEPTYNECIRFYSQHRSLSSGYGEILNTCSFAIDVTSCNKTADIDFCSRQTFAREVIQPGSSGFTLPGKKTLLVACKYPASASGHVTYSGSGGGVITGYCTQ